MKVALIGSASGWQAALDLDDSWEIWCLNNQYNLSAELTDRATRWFELHGDTPLTRARRSANHWETIAAMTIPVYTLYDLPGVRTAVSFPIEEAAAIKDYFSCTFAYQIALALMEGVTELRLYGTPLIDAREALVERPCVEWWLGYAEGRGVTCSVHHDYPYGLGKQPYRYAFNDQSERYLAYRYTYAHHESVNRWIWYEEMRLRVKRPFWERWLRRALDYGYARL